MIKNNRHRINFINGLADKKIYGLFCTKHNVWYNGNCPECEHDIKMKEVAKEIIDKGLFGSTRKDQEEQIKNADQIKLSLKRKYKLYNNNRSKVMRCKLKDDDYRKERNKKTVESHRKKILRRLDHSL
jgi:hypothetical protein